MTPSFVPSFMIGGRRVGGEAPCLIVAEAGVSHFGDMSLARELVDLAADAGADVFKTQVFDVETLIADRAGEWRERLRSRNLTLDQALELKARCDSRGLLFMATAHDETRIPWLRELDVPAVKVGSGECRNPTFLTRLAELGKPMIISTGMYGMADVEEALTACAVGGCDSVALLHCVTSYPTPPEDVNLAAMDALRELFPGPVGYSDHTTDELAVLAAVARGADIVEKHITILRDVPNAHDWKVSAGPENFASVVERVRRVEAMIGLGGKAPVPSEAAGIAWALKSLVARHDLPIGHVLLESDLVAKRPGDGMQPNRIGELLGRRLKRSLRLDQLISMEDLET